MGDKIMINIRPVSDLRNKYPEIEELVLKENEEVYLTKNGYGTMVVMSLEKYSELIKEIELQNKLEERFGDGNMEKFLEEIERQIENPNTKFLTHEEVFGEIRRKLNDQ